jgi:hypothetical protein
MTFKAFQRMAATPAGAGYSATEFSITYQAPASQTSTFDIVDGASISDYNDIVYSSVAGVNISGGTLFPSGPVTFSGGQTLSGWIVFRVPAKLPVNLKFVSLYPSGVPEGGFQWLLSGPLVS